MMYDEECVDDEHQVKHGGLTNTVPTRIHVVAGSVVQQPYMKYDGYRGALVDVMDEGSVECVEVGGPRGSKGRRMESTPALRISEKVWTHEKLTYDADCSASHVVWSEAGVQAVSYDDDDVSGGVGLVPVAGGLSASEAMDRLGMMLFQNQDADAYRDFLSWNDPVDDCQPMHGSLLPLWEAVCDTDREVTSFCWHPRKDGDLFAVGIGSLKYDDFEAGCVCMYSMFDMHMPRHKVCTQASVTCVSFSPNGNYLAIGMQDGGLNVWSFNADTSAVTLLESDIAMHHMFPVWSVRWENADEVVTSSQDGMEGVWRFADGKDLQRVGSRIIGKNDSYHSYDANVFLQNRIESETVLNMVCCSAMAAGMHVYGTLEGEILSHGDGGMVKNSYHKAPVYSISANPFDSEYVLAASLDWSVSLWKSTDLNNILLDIDVGEPLVDAQWSLKSSTIFAVATEMGNVYVYDVAVSKEVPICQQRVCGSGYLTCIRFHSKHPVIFVGTSDGRVLCLKLSPNLRCRKENDEGNEFAFLDEEVLAYTERPTLELEDQLRALHEALRHPF